MDTKNENHADDNFINFFSVLIVCNRLKKFSALLYYKLKKFLNFIRNAVLKDINKSAFK